MNRTICFFFFFSEMLSEMLIPWMAGLCPVHSSGKRMMDITVVFLYAPWVNVLLVMHSFFYLFISKKYLNVSNSVKSYFKQMAEMEAKNIRMCPEVLHNEQMVHLRLYHASCMVKNLQTKVIWGVGKKY